MGYALNTELDVYKRIEKSPRHHPGRRAVRNSLDSFHVDGPSGRHICLVHPPLWESLLNIKHRNDVGRLPAEVLALVLKRLFHALMLLHEECHVVHTDIKEANILLGADSSVLAEFEAEELNKPSPRKEVDGSIIYQTRRLGMPRNFGAPVLCDFGSAVPLDDGREHLEDIQPDVYRAPEVILDIPWTYSVDIWNVGCIVRINENTRKELRSMTIHRYGTPSKASTSSQAETTKSEPIDQELISPRSSPCLVLRLQFFLPGQI